MAGAEQAVGLAIMAKAPRVGAVKTRLCPPLRAPEAAELARCFLLDTVERVPDGGRGPTDRGLHADRGPGAVRGGGAPGFALMPWRG